MFRRAAWLSAGLHVVVVLVVYFGVPDLFDREVVVEPSIRVEVYTIAEETAAPPPAPKPEVEPEPEAPPPPEPEPEVAAVEPPPPEPEPEAEPPPPPEPEVVEPEPEPVPEPEPEPEPQPEVAAAPTPRTKPKPPEKPAEDFSSVLETVALLDKSLEEAPPAPQQQETMLDLDALEGALAPNVASRVTLSEIDAIRRQIEDNWIVPAGAPEAEDLQVEIRIQLAVDGRVLRADIVDQARMVQTGEEFYRSAAESALRAVLKASPLHGLPPEKYDAWRDITMTFDPSKMVGQ
ncbi:MAG: energy transducer TonB [Alphaproteobacteria bacterium]